MSPRMMNTVMILYRWKRFIYHVGRARDQYSIADIRLVAGRKEREDGKQQSSSLLLIFSTAMQMKQIQLQISRKVQYQIHWGPEQDAVYSARCWSRLLANKF